MAVEEKIRELVKEEIETQLEKTSEQASGVSSRIDAIEGKQKNNWSFLLKLRKHTLKQLTAEYRELKSELSPKSEDLDENADI